MTRTVLQVIGLSKPSLHAIAALYQDCPLLACVQLSHS